jgi:hypothetical protein
MLQVYVHHYVSSSKFILGSGAELRGSFHRKPLAAPYALVVDAEDLRNDTTRCVLPHLALTIAHTARFAGVGLQQVICAARA